MPKPKDGESEQDFVSRCIPIVMDEGTAKDNKQASAICYSMYRESKKSGAIMKGSFSKHVKDMMEMSGTDYARQEAWDIQDAAHCISYVAGMCMNEVNEPDDMRSLCNIMISLMEFINGEIKEMVKAASQGDGYEKSVQQETEEVFYSHVKSDIKVPAQVKSNLNLSYVKSLHLDKVPELAVKFVAKDEIKGYSNLWGDPNKVDLEQEYFTKDTNFWDNKPQWLTWDHAQDDEFKSDPRIGNIVEIGDDEWGKWYVARLKKAEAYRKYLDMLIADKKVGSGSDSAPQYVKRVKTGKSIWLSEWPLFAVSLTDNPCEPRMIGSIDFLKSLGIALPDVTNKSWEAEKAKLTYLRNKYT